MKKFSIILIYFWTFSVAAKEFTFVTQTDTTYGQMLDYGVPLFHEAVDRALKQNCYGKGPFKGPKGYNCGEIPYGKYYNSTSKELYSLTVKKGQVITPIPLDILSGSGKILLDAPVTLKLLLDRQQTASKDVTELLDVRGKTTLHTSSRLLDNVTIRHTPKGADLFSLVCGYIPGLSVRTNPVDIRTYGYYDWKLLFIRARESWTISAKVKPAQIKTDHIKVCAVIKTTLVKNVPQVKLIDVSAPQIFPTTLAALVKQKPQVYDVKVQFHSVALKIAAAIAKFFNIADLHKLAAEYAARLAHEQVDHQISSNEAKFASGELYLSMLKSFLGRDLSPDIVASYLAATSGAVNMNGFKYQVNAEAMCKQLVTDYLKAYKLSIDPAYLNRICKGLYAQAEVIPFMPNSVMSAKSCYAFPHALNPNYEAAKMNKWWRNSCAFTSRVTIKVKSDFLDSLDCIDDVMFASTSRPPPDYLDRRRRCAELILGDHLRLPQPVIDALKRLPRISRAELQLLAEKHKVPKDAIQQLQAVLKGLL